MRPLLALVMIVRDEAHGLARTLRSVRASIDRWLVLDTGSTDGTQDLVRRELASVPGALHEEPFVDFATTRNRALDLAGDDAELVLVLDAHDELVGGDALRAFLEGERGAAGPEHEAYYLRMRGRDLAWDSARVCRAAARWRYVGRVHEVLAHPARLCLPALRIPGVEIRHMPDGAGDARSRRRWERDAVLLEEAVAGDATDARAWFYLGQTYECVGRLEEAMTAYRARIALGGWAEEVYEAKYRLARAAYAARRPWPEVLELFLWAHSFAPQRAEPLYAIALHYYRTGDHGLCLVFARRAFELEQPAAEHLFVDEAVYRWKAADLVAIAAWYLGEHQLGRAAAVHALQGGPDDARPRLLQNLRFYDREVA